MNNRSLNREGSPNGPQEGAAPDARLDEAQRSAPINREESLDSGLSRSASELRGTIRYAHIDRVDGSTISEPVQVLPPGGARCPTHCPTDCGDLPLPPPYEQVADDPPEIYFRRPNTIPENTRRQSRSPVVYLSRRIGELALATTANTQRLNALETAHTEIETEIVDQAVSFNNRLRVITERTREAVRRYQQVPGPINITLRPRAADRPEPRRVVRRSPGPGVSENQRRDRSPTQSRRPATNQRSPQPRSRYAARRRETPPRYQARGSLRCDFRSPSRDLRSRLGNRGGWTDWEPIDVVEPVRRPRTSSPETQANPRRRNIPISPIRPPGYNFATQNCRNVRVPMGMTTSPVVFAENNNQDNTQRSASPSSPCPSLESVPGFQEPQTSASRAPADGAADNPNPERPRPLAQSVRIVRRDLRVLFLRTLLTERIEHGDNASWVTIETSILDRQILESAEEVQAAFHLVFRQTAADYFPRLLSLEEEEIVQMLVDAMRD